MQRLVKRAQRGDPEAFVALIEQCKSGMYRIARGFFRDEADVADAIGEAVLAAYEHLGELKKAEYFRTWLMRILINSCSRILHESRRCEVTESVPEMQYVENEFSNVEFHEMLQSFPEDCRLILLLYYGEQFTAKEIAQMLGLNENTVRSRLRRARGELRKVILYNV